MNSTEVCEIAALLAADPILRITLYFRAIIFIAGLILFAVFFKIQGSYLAFHRNARLLLMNSYLWAILQTVTGLVVNVFDIIRYSWIHQDPCGYTLSSPISALLRGPSLWALCGSVWALLAMAVERCVASVTYETYEKKSNGYGKLLLVVQWSVSLVWFSLMLIDVDWTGLKANATISSSSNSDTFCLVLGILSFVELFSLGLFYYLLIHNKQKKDQLKLDASLTEKYQVQENIKAIELMVPMVLVHCVCCLPTVVILPIYMIINPSVDPLYYTKFMEFFNCAPFYSTFLPIVLLWRHRKLRDNLRNALNTFNRVGTATSAGRGAVWGRSPEQVRHFAQLKTMFTPPEVA